MAPENPLVAPPEKIRRRRLGGAASSWAAGIARFLVPKTAAVEAEAAPPTAKRPETALDLFLRKNPAKRANCGDADRQVEEAAAAPAAGAAAQAPLPPKQEGVDDDEEEVNELLRGVDVAEQRRLLKEAEMLRAMKTGRSSKVVATKEGQLGGAKPPAPPAAAATSSIARFFQKK